MRARVLLPLIALGLLAVFAVVVPVCEAIAVSRTQRLTLERAATVDQIVQRAAAALSEGSTEPLLRYLDRVHEAYGEAAVVVDAGGSVVAAAGGIDVDGEAAPMLQAALRALPQWSVPTVRPWSGDASFAAEPVIGSGGVASGAVLLRVSLVEARADVARSWALVALVGIALLAALLAASLRWTTWVLRPVHALDAAATAVAQQRRPLSPAESGPPELRRLSSSFARMVSSVEQAMEQQRAFVADASHQLRNPLAAIRLRIDAAPPTADDDGWREPVDRDLDRLEHIVERMLELADVEHRANADDVTDASHVTSARELVDAVLPRIPPPVPAVVATGPDEVDAGCRRSDLEAMAEILIDNARKYAGADATVTVHVAREDDTTVLEVSDDGPGLSTGALEQVGTRFWRSPDHQGLPGTGLGLAIVQELSRANAGSVHIDRAPQGGLRARVELGRAPWS